MLGKLLKYETKATSRSFLPIYLAILLFALINRLINPFKQVEDTVSVVIEGFSFLNMMRMISGFAYFALIVATIAMTFVIIIQRFYKNLLGDEGYLMFTLPVKPWQIIISKLLVSVLWVVLSFITILCSVLILVNVEGLFRGIADLINTIRGFFGNGFFIVAPIFALVTSIYFILTVYNALSIGHLFTKRKILASFGAYIGIYIIGQIALAIFFLVLARPVFLPLVQSPVPTPFNILTLLVCLTALYTLLGAANFAVANTILNKNLNLE